MLVDKELATSKNIDITNLQKLPMKEVREIATLIDRPEADIQTMEKMIDDLEIKNETDK